MQRLTIAAAASVLLSGCGAPDAADYESALETSYANDAAAFARAAQIQIKGLADPGAMRGTASSARIAAETAEKYGGSMAGGVARDVIGGVTDLASDFGVEGADELKSGIDTAMATEWDVADLEVLASRQSGQSHVAQVRYDLFATVGGVRKRMAQQVTHSIRLDDSGSADLVAVPIASAG